MHRVVLEKGGQPDPTNAAVFLAPGDGGQFNSPFLIGAVPSDTFAVYLASRGVDVWGIDYAWSLAPAGTTDMSFMKSWGLQHDVNDVETALAFAQSIRGKHGSGSRLALLGYSRGGWIGYALLNQESQLAPSQQRVSAFISVDNVYKLDDAAARSFSCAVEAAEYRDIDAGTYGDPHPFNIGQLAQTNPNDTSPVLTDRTNLQALLTIGAASYQLSRQSPAFFHLFAGTFPGGNIDAIPNGLAYSDLSQLITNMSTGASFESVRLYAETDAINCGDSRLGFDTHLHDIRVPVLYLGAGGGLGRAGLYTLSLLGSTQISTKIISFYPPEQAALDFGHVDLFAARDAARLAWEPVFNWLSDLAQP